MKIIHTGDLHLDSKMESNLSREKAKERKLEIRQTFERLVQYASEVGTRVVLICGDMFDSANITLQTKRFLLNLINAYSDIDFLILKGNHDEYSFEDEDLPKNLRFFGNDFKYFRYDNVVISGLNLNGGYQPNVFDLLDFRSQDVNILCLHGQVSNFYNETIDYCIPLSNLRGKNINYLALGHIHKFDLQKFDENGILGYCGILEPRGFDECGEKGFIEIDVSASAVNCKFVPFAKRHFHIIECDVSGAGNSYDMQNMILSSVKDLPFDDIVKVELVGGVDLALETDCDYYEKMLADRFYFAKLVSKTHIKIDLEKLKCDISLKGEFIRTVLEENSLTDEEKNKIISLGIRALTGQEL